jgi:hypothetical protein
VVGGGTLTGAGNLIRGAGWSTDPSISGCRGGVLIFATSTANNVNLNGTATNRNHFCQNDAHSRGFSDLVAIRNITTDPTCRVPSSDMENARNNCFDYNPPVIWGPVDISGAQFPTNGACACNPPP